ncbi:MerR family transcriptional regulator [Nonomuraea sp. NPDC004297]
MPKPLTLQAVLEHGLTYRRLDHWTRAGYLHPAHAGGTGHTREWPQTELQVADLMRRLVDAGLTVDVAALAARAHLGGRPIVKLAPGVVLAIDLDLLAETR